MSLDNTKFNSVNNQIHLHCMSYLIGAVMVIWQLDLQLPMQSVPITIDIASSNLAHGEVYSIQHYA